MSISDSSSTTQDYSDPVSKLRRQLHTRGIPLDDPELDERWHDTESERSSEPELRDEAEILAEALALGRKRIRQLQGLSYTTASRRLQAYLQRRAYSYDVIRKVVTEILPR